MLNPCIYSHIMTRSNGILDMTLKSQCVAIDLTNAGGLSSEEGGQLITTIVSAHLKVLVPQAVPTSEVSSSHHPSRLLLVTSPGRAPNRGVTCRF